MILEFLRKYLTAIELALIALMLAFGVFQTIRLEQARSTISGLHAQAATLQAQRERQRADDERYARAVEGQLRDTAAAIQKESDEAQRTLRARADALSRELLHRPERPAPGSQAAAAAGPPGSGTGAGLYRGDSEFLVRLAASADAVAAERDECRRIYRSAQDAMK